MKNFHLYVGGTNNITYRYDIRKIGDVFDIRIFNVAGNRHMDAGKREAHVTSHQDAIDECILHYKKMSSAIKIILKFLRMAGRN